MHTASMIATYAALNSVPDHQTNNALTDRLTAVRAAAHTAGRLKLHRALSRFLAMGFDPRLSHSIAAKILYILVGNAFPTEG